MGRNPREFSESGIYHIMFRGTNKQSIFLSGRDYEKLLEILQKLKEQYCFEIFAYCLMTNHVHLVIKERELRDISKIMHGLLTKYSRWFNIKYERTGTLMESRYKSKIVDVDEYFLQLVRYVHQNPVKAEICAISEYKWSSYNDYLTETKSCTDTKFLLDMMSRRQFVEFHGVDEDENFDLFKEGKYTDEDLIEQLKRMGIDDPEKVKYLEPGKQAEVLSALKRKFKANQIVRVVGISDYKLRKF